MPDFSNGVATPGGASYMAPLLNFSEFGNLANDYYQGQFNKQRLTTNDQLQQLNQQRIQQGQRQAQLAQAFPQGLPTDPNTGQIDYRQVAATLAKYGDVGNAVNVLQQQPAPLSPMWGGQGQGGPGPQVAQPGPQVSPATAQTAAKIIQVESGGNPNATNPRSSAAGLGQFTDATWLESVKKYFPNLAQGRSDDQILAMRRIPQLATRVTEAFTAGNEQALSSAGLPVTPATTYLAHFAGVGGAVKILNADPNTPVSKLLSADAIKANPFLKGMTARDLEAWAARKMAGPAMVAQNATSAQASAALPAAPTSFAARFAGDQTAQPNVEIANASGNLPPSANAGTPAASRPTAQPSGAAPANAMPAPAAPQVQPSPAPQLQQPQPGPIGPQVPLPKPFQDPQAAIQALRMEAVRYGQMPNGKAQAAALNDWATRIEASLKPMPVNSMTTLVDPRSGRTVFQGPGAAALAATEAAGNSPMLDADAQRYRQTGTLPTNMGRGVQGNAEAKAIRARAAEMEIEAGGDPSNWPSRWQDYKAEGVGKSAAERVRANREENLKLILRVTEAAIPAALEASKALPRGDFVPLNKLIQNGQIMTSNPKLVQFGMANLQLAEHWARAMNPTGVMRETDRDKALSFLSTAYGSNTYESAVRQLETQIKLEKSAVASGKSTVPAGSDPVPGVSSSSANTTTWVRGPDGQLRPQ